MPRLHLQSSTYRKQNAAFNAALAANAHKGDAAMAAALETAAHMGRRVGEALNERSEQMEREASLAQLDLIESLKKSVPGASTTQIGRVVTMADAGRAIDYLHDCMGGVPIRPETRSRIFVLLKADAYGATKEDMKLALDIDTLGQGSNERDGQRAIRWLEARAKHGPDVGFETPAPQPEPVKSTGRPRFDPRRKSGILVAPAQAPQPVAVAQPVADTAFEWVRNPDFVPYVDGACRFTEEWRNRNTGATYHSWETCERDPANPFSEVEIARERQRVERLAQGYGGKWSAIPAPRRADGSFDWDAEDPRNDNDEGELYAPWCAMPLKQTTYDRNRLIAERAKSKATAPVLTPAPVVTATRPARVVPGRPATLPARPATPKPVEAAAHSKFVRMGTIPLEHGWHPSDDLIPF